MIRRSGNALVLTRKASYRAHVVIDGPWVHMTDCKVQHAAGGTVAADKALPHREVSEVRWLDESESGAEF